MFIYLPLIIVGVLLLITGILILLDYVFGGSSEKQITLNNDTKLTVTGDDFVLSTLAANKIFIPSACGGKATCGLCKFRLVDDVPKVKPTEEPFLSKEEIADGVRLSCQVKVKDKMKIILPESLLTAKEFKTVVTEIEELTYDIKRVRFELKDPKTVDFKPGQFMQIKVPGIDVIRAYSLASDPSHTNYVEMLIRLVPKGQATTYVHKALRVGDKAILTGPYGDFFLQEDSDKPIVCIAGGSGKAPIRSILFRLKEMGMSRKVQYFFGAKSLKDLYYTEEFEALQKEYPNFEYIPALSLPDENDNWTGEKGLITEVLDRKTGDLTDYEAYLCGSPGMIKACINVLNKHKIKTENVFFDEF
ncbi:MAG: 2Fe-2S iron-sulfur cluster binding domain-containing protein [Acholeplasmataceae bacterium]|nr:2Fe-2S iron-sulfur cluster binding domain-containing protein [Acholeplasmataceae bacterium]